MKKFIFSLLSIASIHVFAADPIAGKNIYITSPPIPCATCHGTDISKNTSNILNGKSSSIISSAIANNKGGMNMYLTSLSASQIDDIAAYINNPNGTVAIPIISLSSNLLSFPATEVNNISNIQNVVISNTGLSNLLISNISFSGINSTDFVISGNCTPNTSINPSNSCSLGIAFNPKTVGSKTSSLTIINNTNNNPTINLSANSISITPIITPNPIQPVPRPIVKPPVSSPILVPKDQPAVRKEREYNQKIQKSEHNDDKNICDSRDCKRYDYKFK